MRPTYLALPITILGVAALHGCGPSENADDVDGSITAGVKGTPFEVECESATYVGDADTGMNRHEFTSWYARVRVGDPGAFPHVRVLLCDYEPFGPPDDCWEGYTCSGERGPTADCWLDEVGSFDGDDLIIGCGSQMTDTDYLGNVTRWGGVWRSVTVLVD